MAGTRKTTKKDTTFKVTVPRNRLAGSMVVTKQKASPYVPGVKVAKAKVTAASRNKRINDLLTVIERDNRALLAGADRLLKRVS